METSAICFFLLWRDRDYEKVTWRSMVTVILFFFQGNFQLNLFVERFGWKKLFSIFKDNHWNIVKLPKNKNKLTTGVLLLNGVAWADDSKKWHSKRNPTLQIRVSIEFLEI